MIEVTVTVEPKESLPVIHLDGYLSSESAAPLEEAFQQAADAEKVLLVFAEKAFINSAGLAVLFDLVLPAKEQGRQFRVVHPAKHFRKVFDIVGMSKDVEVFEAEEQAITGW